MKTLQLTLADGSPALIHIPAVAYIQAADDQTLIVFIGGGSLQVTEAYDTVAEMFDPERQAVEPC